MLEPLEDEAYPPTRAKTMALLDEVDTEYGEAWDGLRRARQLYAAGYRDEAQREVRIVAEVVANRGERSTGLRTEGIYMGLAWKANWQYPHVVPGRAAKKMLRDPDQVAALERRLRRLTRALEEPYRYARFTSDADGDWRERWHPRAFRPTIEREARFRRVDPHRMWALMYTESRFRRHVVSSAGARGAIQIMPWTGRQLCERLGECEDGRFDADTLFDIDTNARLAAYYFSELLHKFHGQAPMAYASYNGGPFNVSRWLTAKTKTPVDLGVFIEEIPFRETYRYTKRVMEVHATYSLLYRNELPRWTNTVDPEFEDNINF